MPATAACTRDLALRLGAIPVLELANWCVVNNRLNATRHDFIDLRVEGNRSCAWPIDLALLQEIRGEGRVL